MRLDGDGRQRHAKRQPSMALGGARGPTGRSAAVPLGKGIAAAR